MSLVGVTQVVGVSEVENGYETVCEEASQHFLGVACYGSGQTMIRKKYHGDDSRLGVAWRDFHFENGSEHYFA